MSSCVTPSIVRLNIGGTKFCTSIDTLTRREPNSMLAAMFNGLHTLSQDSKSYVFIDRNGEHFGHILNWLRDGIVPILKDSKLTELLREAEYYQLFGLIDGIIDAVDERKRMDGDLNTERKRMEDDLKTDLTRREIIKCIQFKKVRFRGLNLSGLDLSKLDLSDVHFSFACLENVNFSSADLRGAVFSGANLRNANFQDACLKDCLFSVIIEHPHYQTIQPANVDLLEGANFEGAIIDDGNWFLVR